MTDLHSVTRQPFRASQGDEAFWEATLELMNTTPHDYAAKRAGERGCRQRVTYSKLSIYQTPSGINVWRHNTLGHLVTFQDVR